VAGHGKCAEMTVWKAKHETAGTGSVRLALAMGHSQAGRVDLGTTHVSLVLWITRESAMGNLTAGAPFSSDSIFHVLTCAREETLLVPLTVCWQLGSFLPQFYSKGIWGRANGQRLFESRAPRRPAKMVARACHTPIL